MKTKYTLQPEHEARFGEWRDWWIANAFSCEEMTAADRDACTAAIRDMYRLANIPGEPRVAFVASPLAAAVAAGVAAGVWYVREHGLPSGARVPEGALMAAIPRACGAAIEAGVRLLDGGTAGAIELGAESAAWIAARNATKAATQGSTIAATTAAVTAATRRGAANATAWAIGAATNATADAAAGAEIGRAHV